MNMKRFISVLSFLLCICLSLGVFAENYTVPISTQEEFDEKINSLMYENGVQVKKNITDSVSITMSQLGKIYSAGSGTNEERDNARKGDLSSVYDGNTDTFIMSSTSNATEYTVNVPSDTSDFCVLFGADKNHVKYEEIHFVYTDKTEECVLYCGDEFKGSFVYIDVKNTADKEKTLKQIKVVKPNLANYKNAKGESVAATDAVRFYVKEIVVLTDYTEPFEDEYPDEADAVKFFEDYENENGGQYDVSAYARSYTADFTSKDRSGIRLANSDVQMSGKNALDNDFGTYFSHKNENGFVQSFVFDTPITLSKGFFVFDIFSDKANNDVFRFFDVELEYADGEKESVYTSTFYLPPQIMEIAPKLNKKVSKITVTKPSGEEISGFDLPSGASYPSAAVDFKLNEAKFYSDEIPKVNVALGKKATLDTNGGKVSYICGSEKRLTDGFKLNDLKDTDLLAATYDTASPKSFSMTLDLGSVYKISDIEVFGIDKNITASKNNLAWTKYDISDITVTGSLDGKVYNVSVGTTKNYADIDEADGFDKSQSFIALSSPEYVRYLKFTRSGISGYTRISEIRVLTDDKSVNIENFEFDENASSAEVKNYSDEQKDLTLVSAKHSENGELTGILCDYSSAETGKTVYLSTAYPSAEACGEYSAAVIDNFKNLAVYSADKVTLSEQTDGGNTDGTETAILSPDMQNADVFANAVIAVLKPGYDFENLDDNVFTAPENYIYDFKVVPAEKSAVYTLPENAPNGKYRVVYSVTDALKNTYKAYGYCIKADETVKTKCVEDFKNAAADTIDSVIENYTVTLPVLSFDGVYGWNNIKDKIGKMFVDVKNSYIKGEVTGKPENFDALSDVEACMKCAYILYYADTNDKNAFENVFDISGLEYLFDKNIKSEKFLAMFSDTKGENPVNSARLSTALCKIENGTYEDVENALSSYADVLKIDLSYAEEKGVSVAEAAKYIDNKDVKKYKDGMKTYFEAACTKAAENSAGRGTGSGSSSSSKGGGSKSSFPSASPIMPQPSEKESLFDDMQGFEWAKSAVEDMAEDGIISGMGNKKFEPSRNVTRAEFVKILCKAFDVNSDVGKSMNFADVSADDWYEPYVFKFYSAGYINGISEDYFGAADALSRQDAALICARLLNLGTEYKFELEKKKPNDLESADNYAKGSIYNMYNKSYISGDENGNFMPHKNLTRAEAAVLVKNILNLR